MRGDQINAPHLQLDGWSVVASLHFGLGQHLLEGKSLQCLFKE